jgi:hypothetical protein
VSRLAPTDALWRSGVSGPVGAPASFVSQPTKVTPYRGVDETVKVMRDHLLGPRGALSPKVRFLTEYVCELVSPKDYLSEALAIRYFVLQRVPYFRDPSKVEWVRDPEALVDQISASKAGIVRADCDEITCLCAAMWMCAGNDVDFVTVGFQPEPSYSHVFARCKIPKTDPAAYIACDPVAGTREASMLTKVRHHQLIPVELP